MAILKHIKQWLGVSPRVSQPEPEAGREPCLDDFFDEAYELATRDIEWSEEARARIKPVLFSVRHDGTWHAKKALTPVWPEGARWPAADTHWGHQTPQAKASDYAELLRHRVVRVAHRLHRIDQLHSFYANPRCRASRPYLVLKGDEGDPSGTLCGKPKGQPMHIDEVPEAWMMPCTRVGCDCKLFSLSEREVERYNRS